MEKIQHLEEGFLGNAIVAGALAASAIGAHHVIRHHFMSPVATINTCDLAHEKAKSFQERKDAISSTIQKKYKHVKPDVANSIAHLALVHEKPVFPKAEDLVSVAGIESSINPNAISKLKRDPARGLTQIRPKVWGIDKSDLATPEQQIKMSSDILQKYHNRFGDKDKAIHAYNIGETNLAKGKGLNPGYVEKFKKERSLYQENHE
jgi:soluble lytic murein transglycosylase-like protein